jgi:nucleoside-diphosphate-sugar epimerase
MNEPPKSFPDLEAVEEFMTRPDPALVDDLAALDGDILILGVGGKMGPTMARLAKRAAPEKRIVGVARFSEAGLEQKLKDRGVETIACDLLDRDAVDALPKLPNVVFMAGRKFGTSGNLELTWAMNVQVPAIVAEAFRSSRIVAFSTGNIYPFMDDAGDGAPEDTAPQAMGEYAQSCLGRERMFEYFSHLHGTPGRIIRLNYAIDMVYGVLWDVATKVHRGEPVDVTTGYANVIWQGDANSRILRCLAHCTTPTSALNMSGPKVRIRDLAEAFAARMGKTVRIEGTESGQCWLTNSDAASRLMGPPLTGLDLMIEWVADWVARDMPSLEKPTAYDSRDGSF